MFLDKDDPDATGNHLAMAKLFLIGIGGAAGAVSRFLCGSAAQRLYGGTSFPAGTLTVNLLGCLIIGFLGELTLTRVSLPPEWRFVIFVGFLGGFTTFSTFGYETVVLLREARFLAAGLNTGMQLIGGLTAVALGIAAAKLVP
jgi:CrcB protein